MSAAPSGERIRWASTTNKQLNFVQHVKSPTWSEKAPEGRWRAYPYDERATHRE